MARNNDGLFSRARSLSLGRRQADGYFVRGGCDGAGGGRGLLRERGGTTLGIDLARSGQVEHLLIFQPLLCLVIERGRIGGHGFVQVLDGAGEIVAGFGGQGQVVQGGVIGRVVLDGCLPGDGGSWPISLFGELVAPADVVASLAVVLPGERYISRNVVRGDERNDVL